MTNTILVAILSSKTLGPEALLDHGFDWVVEPDSAKLFPLVAKLYEIEQGWIARFRQWQAEGAMGDDPLAMSPGVLVWLVAIDRSAVAKGDIFPILGKVAQMLVSRAPQVELDFTHEMLDAHAIASDLAATLIRSQPIPYSATSAMRKKAAANSARRADAAIRIDNCDYESLKSRQDFQSWVEQVVAYTANRVGRPQRIRMYAYEHGADTIIALDIFGENPGADMAITVQVLPHVAVLTRPFGDQLDLELPSLACVIDFSHRLANCHLDSVPRDHYLQILPWDERPEERHELMS